MTIQLSVESILTTLGIVAIAGLLVGWFFWNYRKASKALSKEESLDRSTRARERRKEQEEDEELRERLLARYRELYGLEKERGLVREGEHSRAMADFKVQIGELDRKLEELKEKYEALEADYHRVVGLNTSLQEDARRRDE